VVEKASKEVEQAVAKVGREYAFEPSSNNARISEEALLALLYQLGFFRDVCKRDEELYC